MVLFELGVELRLDLRVQRAHRRQLLLFLRRWHRTRLRAHLLPRLASLLQGVLGREVHRLERPQLGRIVAGRGRFFVAGFPLELGHLARRLGRLRSHILVFEEARQAYA